MSLSDLRKDAAPAIELLVPGWEVPVYVRQLSAWQLIEIADKFPEDDQERERQFAFLECAIVDADGSRVLADGEARELSQSEFRVLSSAVHGEDTAEGN